MNDYHTAIVTGASSGIGDAVVRALAERGITVHAVARRADRLARLAEDTGCLPHVLDLTDTDALYAALEGIECDILVNNAGMGRSFDRLASASREDVDRVLSTNVLAATHVVRAVTPGMIERGRGHLVNIGSVAGLYPIQSSLYGASKGAIHLMAQNLRIELKGTGVRCTEICPARVRTEFFQVANDDQAVAAAAFEGFSVLEPIDIADAILYALEAPWRVNVSTIEITPTEQYVGGVFIEPVAKPPR